MSFVSVTRLRVRAWRFMPAFALHTIGTRRQVRRADGYIDGALLADRHRTFWTLTQWRDEAAMRGYMTAGAHRAAMPRLFGWCDEASVVNWNAVGDTLPDWAEATTRMRADGRPSRVKHPSPDHAGMTYAEPRLAGSVPLRRD